MANINSYIYHPLDIEGEQALSVEDANKYATAVAKEALESYIKQAGTATAQPSKGKTMINTDGITDATNDMMAESKVSATLISGEALLDNIETLADKFALSRLTWWQKLSITKKNRELAVTIGTYVIVHAIKTGGFGLTKYRVNHKALDYVTLAANQRILKAMVTSLGVDFNIAKSLLSAPEITTGE